MADPIIPMASGMGGGDVSDVGTPAPAQVQQQQPQQQPPNPQQLSIDHDSLFGKAAKMFLGNDNQYSVDANGQMVNNPVAQKPGQFFRNVVAAAILGGAAGANGDAAQGFTGGLVRGGAAGVANNERIDQMKRAQAEQDFKNQMSVKKEQRNQQEQDSQDMLRKAQIAQANAVTLHTNMITQGMGLDQHTKTAAIGKQHFSDYEAAGIEPIFKDVPESDMQQVISGRPGASSMDWEPTGVKLVEGKDGNPTYQYTYSAYDPKGKIPVSKGTIDQWKKDGMDKTYPDLFNLVKPGKELDAQQYIELKRKDAQLYNDTLTRQKDQLSMDKVTSEIKENNARAAAALATATHERVATGQIQAEKTKQQAVSNAFEELNKVGGDFDKLSPKSKLIIGESQAALLPSLNAEVKTLMASGDPTDEAKAKELMGQIDSIRSLSMQAIRHGAAASPGNGQQQAFVSGGVTYNIPQSEVEGFLKLHPDAKASGSAAPAQPAASVDLSSANPNQTVLQSPTGGVQIVDTKAVQTFLKNNPTYKVVGTGTKSTSADAYIK